MKIFKLELLKRLSNSSGLNGSDYYSVFGHFDSLKVSKVSNLEELFRYDSNVIIGEQVFSKNTLFLYTSEDKETIFESTSEKENKICLICCLKLSMENDKIRGYANSEELFTEIRKKVKHVLEQSDRDYEFNVFACLGSFDVIVVVTHTNIDVLELSPILHDITLEKQLVFQSSNSFLAVHNTYNYSGIDSGVRILIRFSLRETTSYDDIKKFYDKNLAFSDENETDINFTYGEHDANLTMTSCSLYKLFYIMGARNDKFILGNKNGNYGIVKANLDEYTNEVNSKVNFTYTRIQIESTSKLIESLNLLEYDKKPPKSQFDVLSDAKEKIKQLYDAVSPKIPHPARRTLMLLVSQCRSLLSLPNRTSTGFRIYDILKKVLEIINENHLIIPENDILHCLGSLSSTMEIAMQSDNVRLDYIDGDDIESISSVTKFLRAYENILQKTSEVFQDKNNARTNLFFIALNPNGYINSFNYFAEVYVSGQNNGYPSIISIHLPNAHYFNPQYSMPYLIHEIGHYMNVTNKSKINHGRNRTIYNYFVAYIKCHVVEYVRRYIDEIIPVKEYGLLFDFFYSKIEYNVNFNVSPKVFSFECEKMIYEACNILYNHNKRNRSYLSILFMQAFDTLSGNKGYINVITKIIREARADIIMVSICELDIEKYLDVQINLMENNFDETYFTSNDYYMRTASVVKAMLTINNTSIEKVKMNLSKKASEFSNKIFDIVITQVELISTTTEYLIDIHDSIKKGDGLQTMNKLNKFYKTYNSSPPLELITIFMDEWYDNVKNGGGRTSGTEQK